MNRMLKLALGAVIATALVGPAAAQSSFPDVPDNHWAYEALRNLKDKVLFGYPDTLYRGNRPLSRYEFAVALNQIYQAMMAKDAGLQDQIDSLQRMIREMRPGGDNMAAMADLNSQLTALKQTVATNTKDISDMRRLMDEFRKELTALGVDMGQMKKDLTDLDGRVRRLEELKPNVAISGDVNLLVMAGFSRDGTFGITPDQWLTGVGRGSYAGQPVGMTRDLTVAHEAAIRLASTNDKGPKWQATLVSGNMLRTLLNQNALGGGFTLAEGADTMYIQDMNVTFDGSLLGRGMGVTIGRFGYQVGDYLMKRSDNTYFFANDRWDSGNHLVDGALLSFTFGKVGLNIWGGRQGAINAMDGFAVSPQATNVLALPIQQSMGADITIPLGSNGSIKGAVIVNDSNTLGFGLPTGPANRQTTYGGEVRYGFGDVKLTGKYAETQLLENNSNRLDSNNEAYDVSLSLERAKWGITGGWRQVNSLFQAQGDWGRIGTVWNPTGFQGFNAHLWLKPSDALRIFAKGEFVEGNSTVPGFGFANGSDVDTFTVGLDYRLSDSFNAMFSYEDAKFQITGIPGTSRQRWYTLGTAWNMSSAASLRTMLQVGDHNLVGGGAFKGGVLSTQFSIKF